MFNPNLQIRKSTSNSLRSRRVLSYNHSQRWMSQSSSLQGLLGGAVKRIYGLFLFIVSAGLITSCATKRPDIVSEKVVSERVLKEVKELEDQFNCRIGISFKDPQLNLMVEHHGDELFHPASTMKVPVMIEAFRQVDEGILDLNQEYTITTEFESFIDGSIFETQPNETLKGYIGKEATLLLLIEQMMVVSDNLATNMLIDICGAKKITRSMRELGASKSYVIRALMDEEAYQAGLSNRMTPNDLTILAEAIETGKAASEESCAEMRRIMLEQEYNDMIPVRLPDEVKVGHKTGSISTQKHDTGIIYTPEGTYYLTIMVDGLRDAEKAKQVVADISYLIYDLRQKHLEAKPAIP